MGTIAACRGCDILLPSRVAATCRFFPGDGINTRVLTGSVTNRFRIFTYLRAKRYGSTLLLTSVGMRDGVGDAVVSYLVCVRLDSFGL